MNRHARSLLAWSLPAPLRTAVLALGAQSALALAYLGLTDAGLAAPPTLVIPFIWVTVAAVALRHTDRPSTERATRALAAGVGGLYALGLAWLAGGIGPAVGTATGLNVVLLPPGWGPVLTYSGASVSLVLFPYRVAGYAALGYLVSLAVRDVIETGFAAGFGGLLALGSCASCALPLFAAVGGALGGAGAGFAVATAVTSGTYLLGTAAYVLAVAVLAVRPTVRL